MIITVIQTIGEIQIQRVLDVGLGEGNIASTMLIIDKLLPWLDEHSISVTSAPEDDFSKIAPDVGDHAHR